MWADGVFDGGPGQNRDVFASRPHAATAKAVLINSADQYAFTGDSHNLARMKQGWGTASAGNLYQQAKANNWKLPILVNETDVLTQGSANTIDTVESVFIQTPRRRHLDDRGHRQRGQRGRTCGNPRDRRRLRPGDHRKGHQLTGDR